MIFDSEGHIILTSAELEGMLRTDISRLVSTVLIPGTPAIFPAYRDYCDFREMVAAELSVHPSCIIFRGSAKIGFSVAPSADKAWMEVGPDSDVDLAVVDPDHFHFLDAEVRRWERDPSARAGSFHGRAYVISQKLRQNRAFYCYRYMDLPDINLVQKYQAAMDKASAKQAPGCNREVTAFFYRDWWSLHSRYEFDMRCLLKALEGDAPAGDTAPRKRTPPSSS